MTRPRTSNNKSRPTSVMRTIPDTTVLRRGLEILKSTITVLNAFNHRHRNQHRSTHWWATFGIFRRSLRKLVDTYGHEQRFDELRISKITGRALWIRENIIPSSYVAFSQLVADNQHSPLGLLLLTELARARVVLFEILEVDTETTSLHDGTSQIEQSAGAQGNNSPGSGDEADRGVVISRDRMAVDAAEESGSRLVKVDHPDMEPGVDDTCVGADADAVKLAVETTKKKKKKKQKRGTDELATLFGSLA